VEEEQGFERRPLQLVDDYSGVLRVLVLTRLIDEL
jgi:hypothetical protein